MPRGKKKTPSGVSCPCCPSAATAQPPCQVYRSPIALGTDIGPIYASQANAQPPKPIEVAQYTYNEEKNQWDVGSKVRLVRNAQPYRLEQFHFHQPGEHPIEGKVGVLEMHLVFTDQDQTVEPPIMLIAVMAFEARLSKTHTSSIFRQIINDATFTIPDLGSYWSYAGSLTEPPFSLNVSWNVANRFLTITKADLQALKSRSKDAEPVQQRDGRDVVFAAAAELGVAREAAKAAATAATEAIEARLAELQKACKKGKSSH